MSNKAEIIIKLDAKGQREVQSALGGVRSETSKLDGSVGTLNKSTSGLASTFSRVLGPAVIGIGLLKLGKKVIDVSAKFQTLNASLITVTGSQESANKSFAWLQDFAAETPFQLDQVVGAFIKMESLGLKPNRESLRSFGNTASAMGKDLNQMIEAVADASVGEFERLKEFGVKARSQGDQVQFTFAGVTTTIKKDAAEITQYLQNLGDTKFAGGMERQMETIGGAMSNMSDSWDYLLVSFGKTGPIDDATSAINTLASSMRTLGNSFGLLKAYQDDKISFWDFLTANPEDAVKLLEHASKLDGELIKLQSRITELKEHKSGNFWWSSDEEQQLQQALTQFEYYKLSLGDIDRLKNAALHNVQTDAHIAGPRDTPPDQGNLDIYSAEGKATPDDTWLMRAKGLDADAIERAKTAKLEISQWLRDQEMIEADQLYESELLRFEQKQDAIYREIEMEQQAADERVRIEAQAQDAMQGLRTAAMANAINVLQLLAGENKAFALAAIGVQTFLALQSAYKATAAAATLAFASQLIPGDPTSMGRALAASKTAWVMGGINMALIGAGGAIQASQALDGSQPAGYGGGTPNSPTVTAPAASTAESPAATQEVHIHFPPGATVVGMSPEEWSRRFITEFRQATEDGA